MVNFDSSDSSLQGLGVLVGSVVYSNSGCTNSNAFNFNPQATTDDGTCCTVSGCTDPTAINYDSNACFQYGVCLFETYGCMDPTKLNYNSNATIDDGSCGDTINYGCTNGATTLQNGQWYTFFYNYDPAANLPCDDNNGPGCVGNQDGENCCCITNVFGCQDPTADNYDSNATQEDGTCTYVVYGCTDSVSADYDSNATADDGSCNYIGGCLNPVSFNYCSNCNADCSDVPGGGDTSCCIAPYTGCMDSTYCSYDTTANIPCGNCCTNINCSGCTDSSAGNFNPQSIYDDGSCCYGLGCASSNASNYDPTVCPQGGACIYAGCMDSFANNVDYSANYACNGNYIPCQPNQSGDNCCCTYDVYGCTDPTMYNYDSAATVEYNPSDCEMFVYGCVDSTACNYNPAANTDDGSCLTIYGCMCDPNTYPNGCTSTDANATCDDGSCIAIVSGCTDSTALNYDSDANTDDGNCILPNYGCTDSNNCYYNSNANVDDGSCGLYGCMDSLAINFLANAECSPPPNWINVVCQYAPIPGCMDPTATTYNSDADTDDGSCCWGAYSCTDPTAFNYNSVAGACSDPSLCTYGGCMDSAAFNYDSTVDFDDGSCVGPNEFSATSSCNNVGCEATLNWPWVNDSKARWRIPGGGIWNVMQNINSPWQVWQNGNANSPYILPSSTVIEWEAVPMVPGNWKSGGQPVYGTHTFTTSAINYNYGCMDSTANNYDSTALTDDGTCTYDMFGCTDSSAIGYDSNANIDDGSCVPYNYGCTDSTADNYDPAANTDDGTCTYPTLGCTLPYAYNYDSTANIPCNDTGVENDCCNNAPLVTVTQNAYGGGANQYGCHIVFDQFIQVLPTLSCGLNQGNGSAAKVYWPDLKTAFNQVDPNFLDDNGMVVWNQDLGIVAADPYLIRFMKNSTQQNGTSAHYQQNIAFYGPDSTEGQIVHGAQNGPQTGGNYGIIHHMPITWAYNFNTSSYEWSPFGLPRWDNYPPHTEMSHLDINALCYNNPGHDHFCNHTP